MDGNRFDDLTRALGAGTSRRRALKLLGGGLAGGAFTLFGRARTDAFVCRQSGATCLKDAQCCSGFCYQETHRCLLPVSDRALKSNFAPVDGQAVLAQVAALPIETWNYRDDDPAVRHLGPMAQDFAAAFGVGADNRHIHPLDGQGVALAAIQGLTALLQDQQTQTAALAARLAALEAGITPA